MPRIYVRSYCTIDGCGREGHGKLYCRPHYHRWKTWGDPLAGKPVPPLSTDTRTCSIDGCSDEFYARDYCRKHYTQFQKHGDPLKIAIPPGPEVRSPAAAEAHFLARLQRTAAGCLEWQAARNRAGYGAAQWEGRVQLAHRIAYQIAHGPIPDSLFVCHHCDNPPCCEPTHLFLGDVKANHIDMEEKGRGFVPEPDRGEEAMQSKLTEEQVREIRTARSMGCRGVDLARQYGVSRSTISSIGKLHTWKHVA